MDTGNIMPRTGVRTEIFHCLGYWYAIVLVYLAHTRDTYSFKL